MFVTLWLILLCICTYYAVTHPLKQGAGIGLLFILSAIIPYLCQILIGLSQPEMHMLSTMSLFAVMAVVVLLEDTKISTRMFFLALGGVVMNMFGLASWFEYYYIYLSNYLFDIFGVSLVVMLGENWIYNTAVILYYLIAMYILYDKEDRKQYVGNGVLQFLGDTVFSYYLRFRDAEECSKKQRKS